MKAGWWSNTEPDTSVQSQESRSEFASSGWIHQEGHGTYKAAVHCENICTPFKSKGGKLGEDIEPLAGKVGVTQRFGECILS